MKTAEELTKLNNTSIKPEDMVGWAKIQYGSGTYYCSTWWCEATNETVSLLERDYDYNEPIKDNEFLYNTRVDRTALWKYNRRNGIIQDGDTVRVIKGKTLPKGFVGTVKSIKPIDDRYGRKVADYIYFTDGNRININNVELVIEE